MKPVPQERINKNNNSTASSSYHDELLGVNAAATTKSGLTLSLLFDQFKRFS